ncbi:MAG: hypothetical protein FJZ09_06395 [Candidatus Omnitrophica bacterium]|nr:hypothetical protein [Candidatus Omnitrophota bacterium]
MKKKLAFLTVFFLILSGITAAQDTASGTRFEAKVVASASLDFIKEWLGAHYNQVVEIDPVTEVRPEQVFYVAAIVSGFGLTPEGGTDIAGDLILIEPAGAVVYEQKDIFAHKIASGHPAEGFIMLDPAVDIALEEEDPEGTYTIRVAARDKVLNQEALGEYSVELKAGAAEPVRQESFASIEDFGKWMTYYYIRPEPEKVGTAIRFYADSELFAKETTHLVTATFFAAALKKDPGAQNVALYEISSSGSQDVKEAFLHILWLVNTAQSREMIIRSVGEWQSDELKKSADELLKSPVPDILNEPVNDAMRLDMLWAMFLATGDPQPVKKIIALIHLKKDGVGEEALLGAAAHWSLASNALQHRKVYDICKEALQNADPLTQKILEGIIQEVDNKAASE